jgi:hypothetical protein
MPSTTQKVHALIEAAEKATAGPWASTFAPRHKSGKAAHWPGHTLWPVHVWLPPFGTLVQMPVSWEGHPTWECGLYAEASSEGDATFIATARNDAPDIAAALLEAVEIVRKLVDTFGKPHWAEHELWSYEVIALSEARAWLAKHAEGE